MKKKKIMISKNYLEQIPAHPATLKWKTEPDGLVTLAVENTGWVNRVVQVLFLCPRVSYVHLDKLGSFVWPRIDGKTSIRQLGELMETAFGEEAHPLYERLAQYFRILDSYRFVEWAEKDS